MKMLPLLGMLCAAPLHAQHIDPDWCLTCRDSQEHFAAGAGIQAATLLVFPRAGLWRRLAITASIGAAYELGQVESAERGRGYGFGLKDLLCDLAGALVVEALRKLKL